MRTKIERLGPLGFSTMTEVWIYGSGIILSVLYSLSFFGNYSSAYNSLFSFSISGKRYLEPGAIMKDFHEVLGNALIGFLVMIAIMLIYIYFHYSYHYQGSKSIYLMKRLPERYELHLRCLTLPLVGITLCILLTVILFFAFYNHYMTTTPSECLTPNQLEKLWREIL